MSARQPNQTKRKRRSSDDEDVEVAIQPTAATTSRPKTPPRPAKAARTAPPQTPPPPPPPPPSTHPRPAFDNASPNTVHRAEHASDTPRASTTLPPPTGFHTTFPPLPNPSAAGPSHAVIPPHIAKHLMQVDHTNPAIIKETAERNAIGENERRIRRGMLGFVRKGVAREQTKREEWENPIVTTEGWPVEYGGLGSRPVWAQDQVGEGGMEGGGVFGADGRGNGEGEEPAERAEAAAAAVADGEESDEAADEVDDPDATEDELEEDDEDDDDDDDDDEIVWLGTRTVGQH